MGGPVPKTVYHPRFNYPSPPILPPCSGSSRTRRICDATRRPRGGGRAARAAILNKPSARRPRNPRAGTKERHPKPNQGTFAGILSPQGLNYITVRHHNPQPARQTARSARTQQRPNRSRRDRAARTIPRRPARQHHPHEAPPKSATDPVTRISAVSSASSQ